MSKTASEYLVEALEKTGVKRVYGVVGDSRNGFTDALRRRKSIDWIHMRHEEAAAFAAWKQQAPCRSPKIGNRLRPTRGAGKSETRPNLQKVRSTRESLAQVWSISFGKPFWGASTAAT